MSVNANKWAIYLQDLSLGQKVVLMALADNSDDHGKCWPGLSHIIMKSGMSRRGVQTVLRQLEEKNLLFTEKRFNEDGGQRSNLYFLNLGKGKVEVELPYSCKFNPENSEDADGGGGGRTTCSEGSARRAPKS